MDKFNYIEELISRVRSRLCYGLDFPEIVAELKGEFSAEDVFLAYHAAKILLKAEGIEIEG